MVGWINALLSTLALGAAIGFAARAAPTFGPSEMLRADALSALLMVCVAAVASLVLFLSPGLGRETQYSPSQLRRYQIFINLFIFSMLLAVSANNVGVMWIAIEATTIFSALLIPLTRAKTSVEASWNYILICSVGIAPMHTWLPDAHSEAPTPLSATMFGVLLAVALYAILRWKIVVDATLGGGYTNKLFIALGLLSLVIASFSITQIKDVSGLLKTMPGVAGLFTAGILAIIGLPPFGLFISEFALIRAGFATGRPWLMGAVLVLLAVAFVAFINYLNRMLYGAPPEGVAVGKKSFWRIAPLTLNLAVLVALGLTLPAPLEALLNQSARRCACVG
jgi:formate hydrogenlyase subunit 3/multisubunit Na+/H+ antiporter MnhD subunit